MEPGLGRPQRICHRRVLHDIGGLSKPIPYIHGLYRPRRGSCRQRTEKRKPVIGQMKAALFSRQGLIFAFLLCHWDTRATAQTTIPITTAHNALVLYANAAGNLSTVYFGEKLTDSSDYQRL